MKNKNLFFKEKRNNFINKKRHISLRFTLIGVFFLMFIFVFIIKLGVLQFSSKPDSPNINTNTTTRTVSIQALRGCIYDRNGVALVTNNYSYDIQLDATTAPKENNGLNNLIISIINDASQLNESDKITTASCPFIITKKDDTIHVEYNDTFLNSSKWAKFEKLTLSLHISNINDINSVFSKICTYYDISKDLPLETLTKLIAIRIDMENNNYSNKYPYTILSNVSMNLLGRIFENNHAGVSLFISISRNYAFPGYASHILGTIGKIQPNQVEYYSNLGYSLDSYVGLFGAEYTFESHLHGEDGEMTIVEDSDGNIVDKYISKYPKDGKNVYLTIDIELQKVAENALKDNIDKIHSIAESSHKTLNGEDANAGSITVLSSNTGEVLALASYPTYDLSLYNSNYLNYSLDENAPLFNRALEGLYAPGSTFKLGIAAAALMENIITTETYINDTGVYDTYTDYKPKCWVFDSLGHGHGLINVSEAIEVSCNYFFYSISDDGNGKTGLGINKMNEYCSRYGLGEPTGIELNEKLGVLAGPNYRINNALPAWAPGDTLQASIGQSDNLFTPLQISVYLSTIINNGIRYKSTILKEIKSYDNQEVYYTSKADMIDNISIPSGIITTIKNAMKKVSENGMAATMFNDFEIEIGAKTGTAEVSSSSSSNAIFSAFAPFDSPEIVVTSIIEHGASGIYAGYSVRDIFAKYFNIQ